MHHQEDVLERALAIEGRYLDDEGFTERVVARLPRRRATWARLAVIATFTVLAAAVAAVSLPVASLAEAVVSVDLSALRSTAFIASAVSLVVVIWAAVTAAVAEY